MSEAAERVRCPPWILSPCRDTQSIHVGPVTEAESSDVVGHESERRSKVEFEAAVASHVFSPRIGTATPDALAANLELKSVRAQDSLEERDSVPQYHGRLEIWC